MTMNTRLMLLLAFIYYGASAGCTLPFMSPSSNDLTTADADAARPLRVMADGTQHLRGCIVVTELAAGGNPYAEREDLEEGLIEKARGLRADTLMLLPYETGRHLSTLKRTDTRSLSDGRTAPSLQGRACRLHRVHAGFEIDRTGRVLYVFSNSPASDIPLHPDELVLSVESLTLPSDPQQLDDVFARKRPGERLFIQWRTREGTVKTESLRLDAR